MYFRFTTNLDAARPDVNRLNALAPSGFSTEGHGYPLPREGDTIVFTFTKNGLARVFDLTVTSVNLNYFNGSAFVELHIPTHDKRTIPEWSEWFKNFRY